MRFSAGFFALSMRPHLLCPSLLHRVHFIQHLHHSRRKVLDLEAKGFLPRAAQGASEGAALDEVVDQPGRVEAMPTDQFRALVLRFSQVEHQRAWAFVIAQRRRALVDGRETERADLVVGGEAVCQRRHGASFFDGGGDSVCGDVVP